MGKVRFNDNTEIVAAVKEGLKRKDGYCPCRLEKIPRINVSVKNFGIRSMIRSLRDTAIVSYITKKSKIIYELLSEHIDWFVKINIKILINPKKLLINPKIFYSFFLLVTL